MRKYKILLISFLWLTLSNNSYAKEIEKIVDVNSKINFLNQKQLQTREINEKLDGKLNHFNTELYYQLKLLDEEKKRIQQKIEANNKILKTIIKEKKANQDLINTIYLSNNNKLTDIYAKMNPRKSARILEKLFEINKKRALMIIMKINKRNLIKILESMKRESAAEITNEINQTLEMENEK